MSSYPPALTALSGRGGLPAASAISAAQSCADSRQPCPEAKLIERCRCRCDAHLGSRSCGGVLHRHHHLADMCNSNDGAPSTCNICTNEDEIGLTAPHPTRPARPRLVLPCHQQSPHFLQHLTKLVVTGGRSNYAVFCGGARNGSSLSPSLRLSLSGARPSLDYQSELPAISASTMRPRLGLDSDFYYACLASADLHCEHS